MALTIQSILQLPDPGPVFSNETGITEKPNAGIFFTEPRIHSQSETWILKMLVAVPRFAYISLCLFVCF